MRTEFSAAPSFAPETTALVCVATRAMAWSRARSSASSAELNSPTFAIFCVAGSDSVATSANRYTRNVSFGRRGDGVEESMG